MEQGLVVSGWATGAVQKKGCGGSLGSSCYPWAGHHPQPGYQRLKVHPGQEDGLQQWGTSVSTWQETLGLETEEV